MSLFAGIMCSSAVLSMFISNTATTAMMVPVVMSLAAEVVRAQRRTESVVPAGGADFESPNEDLGENEVIRLRDKRQVRHQLL